MPVPSAITDLSQTAGSNYPSGGESPITADNYFQAYASFIALLRDGKGHSTQTTLASATATDIGGQNSLYVSVTGTTTITGFGTNYNGPRFVSFTGALILTHSATLVIPGAANITTAAGDACIVVPISGGWKIVSYDKYSGLPTSTVGLVPTGLATASGLTMSTARVLARTTASTGAIEEKTGDEIVGMISTPIPLAKGGTGVAVTRQLAKTSTATLTTVSTGTTLIPSDDTIPQITEGDEYLTISFTPTNASSTLRIKASCTAAHTVAGASLAMCLFQDATANALDVGFSTVPVVSYCVPLDIDHSMTAGTTSAITFRLRVGADTAGTTTINGATGTRRYGGTSMLRITVDEYLP